MDGFKEENDVSTVGLLDSPAVGSLQQCEHNTECDNLSEDNEYSVDGGAHTLENNELKVEDVAGTLENNEYGVEDEADTSEDNEFTADDSALPTGPKIVCAISELRDQQPMTTTLTSADFKVLDELTEDLLTAAVRRSLNVPPISLSSNDEQWSSISRDDSSVASSEMNVPWIIIPSVLDKLVEFDEVSTEIRNANTNYGKHLPPLPSCLRSAPEVEHIPPIAPHIKGRDIVAPADDLADNEQLLTTADNQRHLDEECEPDVLEVKSLMLSEKLSQFEKLHSEAIEVDCKCLTEQLSPVTQPVEEQTQSQLCETSAIEISTAKVESAVTEQIHTPERIQMSDPAISDDNVVVPEEAAESTDIESISVAKSDGEGLERTQVESKYAELPRQGRRRLFMSALGRRFLKVGRMLCCCCCRNSNN